MEVTCHCGAINFLTPTPTPITVYHCHCTECRKQSTTAFGTSAIFPAAGLFPLSPELSSKLSVWTRRCDGGRTMDCYFCKECGGRVMHRTREVDGTEMETVSVKGGMVKGLDWKRAAHIYTRSAVVEIPEGVERWEAAPGENVVPGRKKVEGGGEAVK